MRLPKPALPLVGTLVATLALLACGEGAKARGDRLAKEHRWLEAVEAYERAIDKYPHDYGAAWGIARIYCHEVKIPDRCLAWTDKLLAAYPDRSEYRKAAAAGWRERAAAARRDGDHAAADAAEAKAQALDP
jgi:tetratricopeptide (TPR) repeat protein